MSEIVLQFAGAYIDMGDTVEKRQNYLNSACTAWNISLLSPTKRPKAIKEYIKAYKRYNPHVDDQNCNNLQENLEILISEKDKLFPNDARKILGAEIKVIDGEEHYNVVFINEK